jgi:endoglucanase
MNVVLFRGYLLSLLLLLPFAVSADNLLQQEEPLPIVRVNQVGYLPNAQKLATVISGSASALNWSLKDASGTVVTSGKTTPLSGVDAASGETVHHLDFSAATKAGTGYTLVVTEGGKENKSHPFDIAGSIYTTMRKDALAYFYHNRSGIKIEMPFCGRADLARAVGHPSDIAATWPDSDQENYSLDVTGGWYDAEVYGKYVVNGGISVWTIMNMFERAVAVKKEEQFADGTMNIPENSNSIPDLLDEARWEMNFMLKMQVPEGKMMAGMVHHAILDSNWIPLGLAPSNDKNKRYLRPVSTAATLNLAATAAQASRIWKTFDATFSAKCLTAAEKAWAAALANPAIYAPNNNTGGAPYNDNYVEDEFYWAACELYVTTGKAEYLTKLQASKHYLEMPATLTTGEDEGFSGCFTWGSTQGLGTVTLALVQGNLPEAEVTKARNACTAAADIWIANMNKEGYIVPIKAGTNGYPWGSNSFVLNTLIVMALAGDFTQNHKYLNGVADGMDYLLGRNPNDQCYVTGYGERPLKNPRHPFWAYQGNPAFPKPPAGAISGGPNSDLQDPWVLGSGWIGTGPNARPAAKCFVDHIESWSTNEVAINWNAAFAWVTAYLDEDGHIMPLAARLYPGKNIHNAGFSPAIEASRNCLTISLGTAGEAKISVHTASGRVLYSEKTAQNTGKVIIPNRKFVKAAGLYILNVESQSGSFRKSIFIR